MVLPISSSLLGSKNDLGMASPAYKTVATREEAKKICTTFRITTWASYSTIIIFHLV